MGSVAGYIGRHTFVNQLCAPRLRHNATQSQPQSAFLPRQIIFELHIFHQPAETPPELLASDGGILWSAIRLFQMFDARGFQVALSEYNWLAPAGCCQEYTMVRGGGADDGDA